MAPEIPIGDAFKGGHVFAKSSKTTTKADLTRATGGNDLCLVNDRNKLPQPLKEKTLYVFLNEEGHLTISSHKRQNIIIDDGSLAEGAVTRLKLSVNDFNIDPSSEDIDSLFKYAKHNDILQKTLREKTLRGFAEAAAVGLTLAEGAVTLVAGREYAPKGLKHTTVRKAVKKGKQALSERLDQSELGRSAKGAAIAIDGAHSAASTEALAVVAAPLSAASGIIAGREDATPIPDSKLKKHFIQPTIDAADRTWDQAKKSAPKTTEAVEAALDAKNQFVHSEVVSQGISIAGGVTAALGVTAGVGVTAPISIPILAAASVTSVGMQVNAETKRQKMGREKQYLEDITISAHERQNSLNAIKGILPNVTQILDVSEDTLRELEKPTSRTIGPNHSFAENGIAVTAAINTPFIFVKAATAAASPVTLGLHAAGLVSTITSQISGKFSETDAKHQVQSEIEALKQIIPKSMESDDIYVLANNAKNAKLETAGLKEVTKKLKEDPSLPEEDIKAIFINAKRKEEERLSQENNSIYSNENLNPSNAVRTQIGEQARNTATVLFGKKTTYKQYAGINPEALEAINPSKANQVVHPLSTPINIVAEDASLPNAPLATPSEADGIASTEQATAHKVTIVEGTPLSDSSPATAVPIPPSPPASPHLSPAITNELHELAKKLRAQEATLSPNDKVEPSKAPTKKKNSPWLTQ